MRYWKTKNKGGNSLTPPPMREAHSMLEHMRPQPKGKIVLAVAAR